MNHALKIDKLTAIGLANIAFTHYLELFFEVLMTEDLSLEERIVQMKKETMEVCSLQGKDSSACAVRLEILEEMRAAIHDRNLRIARESLREFCLDHYCSL
jgi:CP12 domain